MKHQDQAMLSAILETAVDAIVVIDSRGTIQSVNPSTMKLFGFARDEMIGQNVKMLMPSPFQEQHDGYLESYMSTRKPKIIGVGREVVGKRKDGSTFPMHLAVSEIRQGDTSVFAGIVRDISDLKNAQDELAAINEDLEQRVRDRTEELRRAQEELIRAERLATLGQVSGGIAHEIRNPLNAVRTSVYYLQHAKSANREKIQEHLDRIDRQVSLVDNVVTALSDIARLPEPAARQTDLNELLPVIVKSVSLPAGIEVEYDLPQDPLHAFVDPNQLSIVFRNLVRNAKDAMQEKGTIMIRGRSEDDGPVIEVVDNGMGISESDLQRITEPLFSTKARGMGLGLAITTAILKKNLGRLEITSSLGEGSTFSVHLRSDSGSDVSQ